MTDELDQEAMVKEAAAIFAALHKNFTPRAIAILKAGMESANCTSNDYVLMEKAHDQQIEAMVNDTGDASLTITSLMMVLGLKIEKLLEILMLASSKSEKIKTALKKHGIIQSNEETVATSNATSTSLPQAKLVQKSGSVIMFGPRAKPEKPN
jgi:hypothetical protein